MIYLIFVRVFKCKRFDWGEYAFLQKKMIGSKNVTYCTFIRIFEKKEKIIKISLFFVNFIKIVCFELSKKIMKNNHYKFLHKGPDIFNMLFEKSYDIFCGIWSKIFGNILKNFLILSKFLQLKKGFVIYL